MLRFALSYWNYFPRCPDLPAAACGLGRGGVALTDFDLVDGTVFGVPEVFVRGDWREKSGI